MPASKKAGITRTRPTWRSQRSCAATVSWFIPLPVGTRGRLLDPCAGEGEIASLLGRLLNCETLRSEPRGEAWGCELFPYRAEKVAARIDKCHIAVWVSCSLTDESVTLLWLNPPYDDDRLGDEKRLELSFLKSTTLELARNVLRGAELDDLQSLFADEMRVCKLDAGQRHSPMGCPTEISPVLLPMQPLTWLEWMKKHQARGRTSDRSRTGKHGSRALPRQLSIWDNLNPKGK